MSANPRINVTFDDEAFNQIKLIAYKEGKSMSEIIREWTYERLDGELSKNNIDFVCRLIREQLRDVLQPHVDRLAAISAKGGVQSATAAYLTAETIARFVPPDLQEDVQEVYLQARKKAVRYMQQKNSSLED